MLHFARAKIVQKRSPLFVFFQIFGDVLGDQNVPGVTASHHPLRHVEPGAGEIGVTIHIDHSADRPAVNAHPKLQAWMFLVSPTNLHGALCWCFGTGIKHQRHTIAGRDLQNRPAASAF